MTISELHTAFKIELDKTSALELPAFEPEEIDYWLNEAVKKYVKLRYREFEKSQKRMDDLRPLIKEYKAIVLSPLQDSYQYKTPSVNIASRVRCSLPFRKNNWAHDKTGTALGNTNCFDYWFIVEEGAKIAYKKLGSTYTTVTGSGDVNPGKVYLVYFDEDESALAEPSIEYPTSSDIYYYSGQVFIGESGSDSFSHTAFKTPEVTEDPSLKNVPVKPITSLELQTALTDPHSEHIMRYEDAKPLRLIIGDEVELITDSTYGILYYYVKFIKRPEKLNITTTSGVSSIEPYLKYKFTSSGTYNGVSYNSGDYFYGVEGVTSLTGTADLVQTDCELPEHTHDEIVKLAVGMALENIEQPRYKTYSAEIGTME